VKRTPLRRRTPLRARAPMRRAPRDRGSPDTEPGAELAAGGPNQAAPEPDRPQRSAYRQRERHTAYMLWVKRQPCLMHGVWGSCEGRVEADHAGRRGAGRKAHDSTCIPLCRRHHQASRFPRAWTQEQRRAWLHAAVVYTQAIARAAGVAVPVDPEPMTEYAAMPLDLACLMLADPARREAWYSALGAAP
jgi:hypothetical protein